MKGKRTLAIGADRGSSRRAGRHGDAAQDKYALRVPDGLAFSEFRGYRDLGRPSHQPAGDVWP